MAPATIAQGLAVESLLTIQTLAGQLVRDILTDRRHRTVIHTLDAIRFRLDNIEKDLELHVEEM